MKAFQESHHPKSNSPVHFIDGTLPLARLTVIASAAQSCWNSTELSEDYLSVLCLFGIVTVSFIPLLHSSSWGMCKQTTHRANTNLDHSVSGRCAKFKVKFNRHNGIEHEARSKTLFTALTFNQVKKCSNGANIKYNDWSNLHDKWNAAFTFFLFFFLWQQNIRIEMTC